MASDADRDALEELTDDECLELLATAQVGRLAYVADGGPMILPVNHVVDGYTVAFRTTYGSKLAAASMGGPVAFEVDGYDPDTRTGWSVLVRGSSETVMSDEVAERLDALGLEPWADAVERHHWVRIHPDEITGRRILPSS